MATPTDHLDPALLPALLELAQRLGIVIRYERLEAEEYRVRGGACRLGVGKLVILDPLSAAPEQAAILRQVLRSEDLERIFLPPALRDYLQAE